MEQEYYSKEPWAIMEYGIDEHGNGTYKIDHGKPLGGMLLTQEGNATLIENAPALLRLITDVLNWVELDEKTTPPSLFEMINPWIEEIHAIKRLVNGETAHLRTFWGTVEKEQL